jgi:hypothetical protein
VARCNLRRARVNTDNMYPRRLQLSRERAVTAAEIKDSFPRLGREPFQDTAAQGRDIAGITLVAFGIPIAWGRRRHLITRWIMRQNIRGITERPAKPAWARVGPRG